MKTFLDRAMALHTQGYRVIPIKPGTKKPVGNDWPNTEANEKIIQGWARNGYANGNIGILARDTPAVDIDVYDAEIAGQMEEWMLRNFGDDLLVRVGQAPKRLLMFRARTPFKKMECVYKDTKGKEHRIEVLGDGQQYLAYGVHPDTGKEYTWTSLDEPLYVPARDLPEISGEDIGLIFDKFEAMAKEAGWSRVRRSDTLRESSSDTSDSFETAKRVVPMTLEDVKSTLDYVPNNDENYDRYLDIGFALHHQFGGSSEGLELWHEWAKQSAKYDGHDLNTRWESMGHGPDTKTFATVVFWANEYRKREAKQEWNKALNRLTLNNDLDVLWGDIAKSLATLASDDIEVDQACQAIQARIKEITTTKPRLASITKRFMQLRPKPKSTARDQSPAWVNHWVYISKHTAFFNTLDGRMLGGKAFDAEFGRELITEEMRLSGESFAGKASDFALNLYEIPVAYDLVYLPGESPIIEINGQNCVNSYLQSSVPASRPASSPQDYLAITRMEKHFETLFPDERERRIFMDFLAFNVQFPSAKVHWATLIQGVDGAGKSYFSQLMTACLGGRNVSNVPGEALKEKYTSWATGRKMVFIEEVRMHGNNKYEVLDRMKPFITNQSTAIRRMGTDLFETINVTNYVLFSNYDDALPIDMNDRRYFIIRTCFLTKRHIDKFNAENPTYFTELFDDLQWYGDAIHDYWQKYRISDDFKEKGHAPHTDAKDLMRNSSDANAEDDLELLDSKINQGDPELSDDLLNSDKLRDTGDFIMPGAAFGYLLKRAGFAKLGRYRVTGSSADPLTTFYTKNSGLFSRDALNKIREMIGTTPIDDGFGDET